MWLRHFLCTLAFGHRKKHLSVEVRKGDYGGLACSNGWHARHYAHEYFSLTRWVCERCGLMGETCLGDTKKGRWTIVNGRLAPDEKTWGNFSEK
jgi:hypothetical protein